MMSIEQKAQDFGNYLYIYLSTIKEQRSDQEETK
jgi:hypothetical protein